MSQTTIVLAYGLRLLREGLRALLEAEADFTIVGEVANGLEVADLVGHLKPNMLIVDLMLPGLDGFQVARQLKGDPATRAIPIVAVSAMARPDDREAALAAGCDDFVRKPFELDDLEALIRKYLSNGASF
jgi:CheY-like chemotaxis protein